MKMFQIKPKSLSFVLLITSLPMFAASNAPNNASPAPAKSSVPTTNQPVVSSSPPAVTPAAPVLPPAPIASKASVGATAPTPVPVPPPTPTPPPAPVSAPAATTIPSYTPPAPPAGSSTPSFTPPSYTPPMPPANGVPPSFNAMPNSSEKGFSPEPGAPGASSQGPFAGSKLVSKNVPINQAHAKPSFEDMIQKKWQGTSSANNPQSHLSVMGSTVTMRGEEQDVIDLENYIVSLDKPVVQVRVDAIILFAQRNYNFDIGIDWSGIYNRAQSVALNGNPFGFVGLGGALNDFPKPTGAYNSVTATGQAITAQSQPTTNNNLLVDPTNFALNLFNKAFAGTTAQSAGSSFVQIPFVFGGADLNLKRLNLVLNAAETESKVKIISRPSVLTGSAQTATVNIGQQLPMQQSSINQSTGTIFKSGQVVYKSVGISLTVTPTVGSDNKTITLNIKIGDIQVISGTTTSNNDGIMTNPPVLSDLSVTNTVVLKSGQTTVIGGLATRSDRKTTNRVPLLYRIPVFGNLFQASLSSDSELEQFIFITPTIVEENVY